MEVTNDNCCSWIQDLIPRTNIKTLQSNEDCEWLVVGAGYTGLSAARKLAQLYQNQKIILVDAQVAGEGASSRNSGYLVDTTLNDGFTSNKELDSYKKKADIYDLGINTVKKFINGSKKIELNISPSSPISIAEVSPYFLTMTVNPDQFIKILNLSITN